MPSFASLTIEARGSKGQHNQWSQDFLSDDDGEDELVSHALQLLEVALHSNQKSPVLARRVANARKSFYGDATLRQALCKDIGSLCQTLAGAFQNSRAVADEYSVEFMTDVLRLALQHERQELPFRMTIFTELCFHARRHHFVFDALQLLLDQCRDVHERSDYHRYLLRGPDMRDFKQGAIVALLTTVSKGTHPQRMKSALGLLHDMACTSPSELAYNMARENALPQLVHCFRQQAQQGFAPGNDVEMTQQLIAILDNVLQCVPLSEGESEDSHRLAEAHIQTQAILSATLPRDLLSEGLTVAIRALLSDRVSSTPVFALLKDAAWLSGFCLSASAGSAPAGRTVTTTGGLQLPLNSRTLLPTVRLLKTLCTSSLPAAHEVAAACDAAAALAAVMFLQPMSDPICSPAGQAIEALVSGSNVALMQAAFLGRVDLLALLDAMPDEIEAGKAKHRTGCTAAKARIVHAMVAQLNRQPACLERPSFLCTAPMASVEPMALSPLAVIPCGVDLDDGSSLSPCSVLLSSSLQIGDVLSPSTSLELSPRADDAPDATFQDNRPPVTGPVDGTVSHTEAPHVTACQVLDGVTSRHPHVWDRLLQCTVEFRKHLGQHLCWDSHVDFPSRAQRLSMMHVPRLPVSGLLPKAAPTEAAPVDLDAVDLGVQLSIPARASSALTGGAPGTPAQKSVLSAAEYAMGVDAA